MPIDLKKAGAIIREAMKPKIRELLAMEPKDWPTDYFGYPSKEAHKEAVRQAIVNYHFPKR